MKLLSKTTLIIITVSLIIFLIGGYALYGFLASFIENRVENELVEDMNHFQFIVNSEIYSVEEIVELSYQEISCKRVSRPIKPDVSFKDTIIYSDLDNLFLPYRVITFSVERNEQFYAISLHKSLIETYLLIEHIAFGITAMVLIFIASILLLNRYLFRKIWSDFFQVIERMQKYDLNSPSVFTHEVSEIIEFNQLNDVVVNLTEKIQNDFVGLKEFTGNISHEIQTPLAIIKSKIELLLQSESLTDENVKLISDIYSGANRLSKFNQTLILLTKIEHNQFTEKECISIDQKLNYHISNLDSFLDSKLINVAVEYLEPLCIEINNELADILLINLLKNAIRHNILNGKITIVLSKKRLIIANNGDPLKIAPNKIFERFITGGTSQKSIGLGLAIVKKICDLYSFKISYAYANELHVFQVDFD